MVRLVLIIALLVQPALACPLAAWTSCAGEPDCCCEQACGCEVESAPSRTPAVPAAPVPPGDHFAPPAPALMATGVAIVPLQIRPEAAAESAAPHGQPPFQPLLCIWLT
jgi:hypothetical protein